MKNMITTQNKILIFMETKKISSNSKKTNLSSYFTIIMLYPEKYLLTEINCYFRKEYI